MRDIKFRGKNNGKLIYGFLRRASNGDCFISYEHDHKWYELQVNPETVGEYTGLKDKNGKEIYEGDIVGNLELALDHFDYYEVIYHLIEASFIMVNKPENHRFDMTIAYHGKIIGNIHDNPELLEKA